MDADAIPNSNSPDQPVKQQAIELPVESHRVQSLYQQLFHKQRHGLLVKIDRLMAGLLVFQWICGIIAAVFITPWTWLGADKLVHPHIWMAVFLGGAITVGPVALCSLMPGQTLTRIVVAIAQMLWSGLLIHLTGGRLETHFHVFGSLAFLAFYLDWKVLLVATLVVGADHFVRGVYFPQSVFGTAFSNPYRWLEHVGWVVFENCFLLAACTHGLRAMRETAFRSAQLQYLNEEIESVVEQRTSALAQNEARFRAISASSPVGIYQVDDATNCIYTNARWHEIMGTNPDTTDPIQALQLVHPKDHAVVAQAIANARDSHQDLSIEYRIVRPCGELRWVHNRSRALYDPTAQCNGRVGTLEDITDRIRDAEALERGAYYDSLTELPNRVAMRAALDRALARTKRRTEYTFALLFLDLDRFKIVNDSLGHTIGDKLLIEAAQRLESSIRKGDMVARLGGDEFVILMDDIACVSDATALATHLQEQLSKKFAFDGNQCFVTASIGITLSTMNYEDSSDMIRDADVAMYRAKGAGGATHFIFDKTMHQAALDRLRLESDLRSGLNHSQFSLAFQPITNLKTGELLAFEALVRWIHPQRGLINPADFIPIAEETNLILPLGNQVLRMACYWILKINNAYPDFNVALTINVSGLQLTSPEFIEQLSSILAETGIRPQQLNLEITETILMHNAETTAKTLQQLRALGVKLWVDDFGTGYSSLSYLDRFPLDVLKIDRSFVSGKSSGNTAIIKAIIALAQSLDLQVVGEGIETTEQLTHLSFLGCEMGQGHLIDAPLSGDQAEKLLASRKAYSAASPGSFGFQASA